MICLFIYLPANTLTSLRLLARITDFIPTITEDDIRSYRPSNINCISVDTFLHTMPLKHKHSKYIQHLTALLFCGVVLNNTYTWLFSWRSSDETDESNFGMIWFNHQDLDKFIFLNWYTFMENAWSVRIDATAKNQEY